MGVLQFFLDKNVYLTGDFINGKLEFIKGRHVTIDGVYVDLIITEIAHDSVSESYKTKSNVLHKTRVTLAGGKGTKGFSIDSGTYSWAFKIQIPNGLPSAISHPSGRAKVLFELKGFIDALGAGKESVKALTVFCQKDLQQIPFDPPTKKDEKKFFMSKGTLQLESKLDRSLTFPGAQIFADIAFVNESSKKLTSLAISVVQLWKLKKSTDRVVVKQYKFTPPEFPIATGGKFHGKIGFNIPEHLPLTTNATSLFNLFYVICVEGYVGNSSEISVDLPLLMTIAVTQPAKEVVTIHSHTVQHVPVFVPVHVPPNYPMPPPYQQPPPNMPPSNNYPYNPLGGSLPMGKPHHPHHPYPPLEADRPRSQSVGMPFPTKPLPSVPYTNPPQQFENPPQYYDHPPPMYENPPVYPSVPNTKLPQYPDLVAPSAPPMYN